MKKSSGTGVSWHESNFEDYITEYAKANELSMNSEEWERALAAAKRLDYTEDRGAQPTMRLVPSEPSFVSRLVARLLRRSRQQVHLSELDDIQAFLKQVPKAATMSEISWGPLRNGFGTWVIAILRPGGQQEGSRPTPPRLKDAPEWEQLVARRLLNGRPLYVRGHLLHDEAGGPGVDYNEVILTAAVGGDFGANHANWVHRYLIEGILLWAYRNMHSHFGIPTITEIYYQVVADYYNASLGYNRQPREGTQQLQQIAIAYEEAVERVRAKSVAEGFDAEPTHQQVMVELTLNSPASLRAASAASPHLHGAMSAVAAEPGEHWKAVHERIMENQKLWAFEDANVPQALLIRYSWVEDGVLRGPWQETVSIILPTSLAARFKT